MTYVKIYFVSDVAQISEFSKAVPTLAVKFCNGADLEKKKTAEVGDGSMLILQP